MPGTLGAHCQWCGVPLTAKTDVAQLHCNKGHGKRHREDRARMSARPLVRCPHPEKLAIGTRGTAIRLAVRNGLFFYRCGCWMFHLTKSPNNDSVRALQVAIPRLTAAGVKVSSKHLSTLC